MSDFANASQAGESSRVCRRSRRDRTPPSLHSSKFDAGLHANSAESFNDRVRRTIAGVFHHISPEHADLYFNEVGFRWSQRVRVGNALRRTRKGREIIKPV